MSDLEKIQDFENQKIHTVWVEDEEEWFFSVKDVVSVLTESKNPKDYISKMRRRDPVLSEGWGQIVHPLPVQTAGVAQEGAEVAKAARKDVEKRLGHSVVSPERAIDYIHSPEELPFPEQDFDDTIDDSYRNCNNEQQHSHRNNGRQENQNQQD